MQLLVVTICDAMPIQLCADRLKGTTGFLAPELEVAEYMGVPIPWARASDVYAFGKIMGIMLAFNPAPDDRFVDNLCAAGGLVCSTIQSVASICCSLPEHAYCA